MRKPMYSIGLFFALVAIIASLVHLNLGTDLLYDFVALSAVIGGTLAVAVSTLPWNDWRLTLRTIIRGVVGFKNRDRLIVETSRKLVNGESLDSLTGDSLAEEVLRRGVELMGLNFEAKKIEFILDNIIATRLKERNQIAQAVRGLSKYPPAFGLAGTVLGLIHLMRSMNADAEASTIGMQMSVALLATFYGILTANLLVNPLGDAIKNQTEAEADYAEIALTAVTLRAKATPLLLAQETLFSIFPTQLSPDYGTSGEEDVPVDGKKEAA